MAAHDAASLPLIPNANCPKDWRTNREVRFEWRQQRAHQWINFADIAEWLAELNGRDAYSVLQRDLLAGDFEVGGKSQVRFIHLASPMARMTRERLNAVLDMVDLGGFPADVVRSEYLGRCWIPRQMFKRWLAKHELSPAPTRFDPQEVGTSKHEPPAAPMRVEQGDGTCKSATPRTRGAKPVARAAVERFINARWPDGVPPEISNKQIALDFQKSDGGFQVGERTVRRALGGK